MYMFQQCLNAEQTLTVDSVELVNVTLWSAENQAFIPNSNLQTLIPNSQNCRQKRSLQKLKHEAKIL